MRPLLGKLRSDYRKGLTLVVLRTQPLSVNSKRISKKVALVLSDFLQFTAKKSFCVGKSILLPLQPWTRCVAQQVEMFLVYQFRPAELVSFFLTKIRRFPLPQKELLCLLVVLQAS